MVCKRVLERKAQLPVTCVNRLQHIANVFQNMFSSTIVSPGNDFDVVIMNEKFSLDPLSQKKDATLH